MHFPPPVAGSPPMLGDDLIWREVRAEPGRRFAGAWFLDRDGTVIEERDYLADPTGVALIPGAAAVLAAAGRAGLALVLVTNQSGIGRGYFDWTAFAAVQAEMLRQLAAAGVGLDAIYACPFHPAGRGIYAHPDHPDRKPRPGMITRALADLALDPRTGTIIGDKPEDLTAGKAAGLRHGVLVETGHGAGQAATARALAGPEFSVTVRESLAGVVV